MYYLEEAFSEDGNICFSGDWHFGDARCRKDLIKSKLDYCKENGIKLFSMGDLFNVAGRNTKSGIVGNNFNEYQELLEFLEPYKDIFIGAIDGNHEVRMINDYGLTPTQFLCSNLKIPYCGTSCIIRVKCGERPDNRYMQNYYVYCHHTTGGGSSQGSKVNVLGKLRDIVEGCDVYCGGHTHQLSAIPQDIFKPSMQGRRLNKETMWFVGCGSFLDYDGGYAEGGMLRPATLGCPIVTFDNSSHKCLINFQ